MELTLPTATAHRIWLVLLLAGLVLGGLSLLGRAVTPVEAAHPVLLTPDRWQAGKLARRARSETRRLHADANRLLALLNDETPDPVAAMLLAQGIYARHRSGTSATGTARQALIGAAEQTAAAASGAVDRSDALFLTQRAVTLLGPLTKSHQPSAVSRPRATPVPTPRIGQIYLPLLLRTP